MTSQGHLTSVDLIGRASRPTVRVQCSASCNILDRNRGPHAPDQFWTSTDLCNRRHTKQLTMQPGNALQPGHQQERTAAACLAKPCAACTWMGMSKYPSSCSSSRLMWSTARRFLPGLLRLASAAARLCVGVLLGGAFIELSEPGGHLRVQTCLQICEPSETLLPPTCQCGTLLRGCAYELLFHHAAPALPL